MSKRLRLDRKQLAALFNNNHQAIVAFEKVLGDNEFGLPTTIEEAAAQATQALAMAGQALALVHVLMSALEAAEAAPAPFLPEFPDDTAPRVELGNMAAQNSDNVRLDGGTIGNTPIGINSASTGAFTTVQASGAITSTVATGAAPLVIASTTRVPNLNVARAALADTATTAAALTSPTTFPAEAVDLDTAITLVNALRAAAITKGL